jgi:hypothetical protein
MSLGSVNESRQLEPTAHCFDVFVGPSTLLFDDRVPRGTLAAVPWWFSVAPDLDYQ